MDEYNIFFSVINGNFASLQMSESNKTANYTDFQNNKKFVINYYFYNSSSMNKTNYFFYIFINLKHPCNKRFFIIHAKIFIQKQRLNFSIKNFLI